MEYIYIHSAPLLLLDSLGSALLRRALSGGFLQTWRWFTVGVQLHSQRVTWFQMEPWCIVSRYCSFAIRSAPVPFIAGFPHLIIYAWKWSTSSPRAVNIRTDVYIFLSVLLPTCLPSKSLWYSSSQNENLLTKGVLRWVYFFIWTDLEKFSITLLNHQRILCSEWVPSELESRQLKKHHNNPHVIHTTPVHQLISCEVKSCMFVRNISIMKAF